MPPTLSIQPEAFNCYYRADCFRLLVIEPNCSNGFLTKSDRKYSKVSLVVMDCVQKAKETNKRQTAIFWIWNSEKKLRKEITRCRYKTRCYVPQFAVNSFSNYQNWIDVMLFSNTSFLGLVSFKMASNDPDKTLEYHEHRVTKNKTPARILKTSSFDKNDSPLLRQNEGILAFNLSQKVQYRNMMNNTVNRNSNLLKKQISLTSLSTFLLKVNMSNTNVITNEERKNDSKLSNLFAENKNKSLNHLNKTVLFEKKYKILNNSKHPLSHRKYKNQEKLFKRKFSIHSKNWKSVQHLNKLALGLFDNTRKQTDINKKISRKKRRASVDEANDLAILMQDESPYDKEKITEMVAEDFVNTEGMENPLVSPVGSSFPGRRHSNPNILGNSFDFEAVVKEIKGVKDNEENSRLDGAVVLRGDPSASADMKANADDFHLRRLKGDITKKEKQLAVAEAELRHAEGEYAANTNDKPVVAETLAKRKVDAEDTVKKLSEHLHKLKDEYKQYKQTAESGPKGTKRKLHGLVVIDPMWGDWSPWSKCSADCGDGGFSVRRRDCDTLPDVPCEGINFDMRPCNAGLKCEAQWQDWGNWGPCSVSCGKGVRARSRVCMSGDKDVSCAGESSKLEKCEIPICEGPVEVIAVNPKDAVGDSQFVASPSGDNVFLLGAGAGVDAGSARSFHGIPKAPSVIASPRSEKATLLQPYAWSIWGQWSTCSKNCGEGQEMRVRACLDESKTSPIRVKVKHCTGGVDSQTRACMGQCNNMPYEAAASGAVINEYDELRDGAVVIERDKSVGPKVVANQPEADVDDLPSNSVILETDKGPVVVQAENSELSTETIVFIVLLVLCVLLIIVAFCIWFYSRIEDSRLNKKLASTQPFYKEDHDDHGNDAKGPVYGYIKPVIKGDGGNPVPETQLGDHSGELTKLKSKINKLRVRGHDEQAAREQGRLKRMQKRIRS
ncbi:uncharacterized protein LOC131953601 [Physella acuta]|uniref:uncharacterized protein LOC131953601 n=1 Tax=Physella acuta TaxID=109671 RepID=UPI0027DDD00A|nr:uncharacterized protein LOC131953601 [Physella acuta]